MSGRSGMSASSQNRRESFTRRTKEFASLVSERSTKQCASRSTKAVFPLPRPPVTATRPVLRGIAAPITWSSAFTTVSAMARSVTQNWVLLGVDRLAGFEPGLRARKELAADPRTLDLP